MEVYILPQMFGASHYGKADPCESLLSCCVPLMEGHTQTRDPSWAFSCKAYLPQMHICGWCPHDELFGCFFVVTSKKVNPKVVLLLG
jgi:hypothetical protein